MGEFNRELWNSGDEEMKNQVRKQKRKLSYYSNVYIVKDPANPDNEGTVRLFRYGKKIHDKIMEAVNGDELEGTEGINPFDFWTGANFKLRAKKVAGYPNYDSSEFQAPDTLDGLDDPQLESIWNRQHKLQEIIAPDQFKTYDQLQARLNAVLNLKRGGDTAPAPVATTPSVSAAPVFAKKEEVAPEPVATTEAPMASDDDDVMDYFRKLAEQE